MISTSSPILPADLDTVWDGVNTVRAVTANSHNQTVSCFDFAQGFANWAVDGYFLRRYSPMTDTAILGIVITCDVPSPELYNFTLTGAVAQPITHSFVATIGTRSVVTMPAGRYAVQGGSTLDLKFSSPITLPLNLRVMLVTDEYWTRT